jgi:AcrR family transcriptional regulator
MSPPAQAAELRRQQNRAEVRRTILEATQSLIEQSGGAGFSIRSLVDRCGYSAPTVYYYFGDKPGLLEAVLEERLQDLVEALRRAPLRDEPVAATRDLILIFARWGIDNPVYYDLNTRLREEDRRSQSRSGQMAADLMSKPLDPLVESGAISEADLELMRQSIWACVHGLISLPAVRPDLEWKENLLEVSIDAILHGWLAAYALSPEMMEREI